MVAKHVAAEPQDETGCMISASKGHKFKSYTSINLKVSMRSAVVRRLMTPVVLGTSLAACGLGGSAPSSATNSEGRPQVDIQRTTLDIRLESGSRFSGCIPAGDAASGLAEGQLRFTSDTSAGYNSVFLDGISDIEVHDREADILFVRTNENSEFRQPLVSPQLQFHCEGMATPVTIISSEIKAISISR
jgi:hypothetical protein